LAAWSLGLEQYEAAFRENAIDETILPSLTTEDQKAKSARASSVRSDAGCLSNGVNILVLSSLNRHSHRREPTVGKVDMGLGSDRLWLSHHESGKDRCQGTLRQNLRGRAADRPRSPGSCTRCEDVG